VSTASSSMERRSPFNVGEKNIVVVSTPSQNGIYPDIRTTNSIPAQVGIESNKLLIKNIYGLNQTILMIAVILGRFLNQDSLENTGKFRFTKLVYNNLCYNELSFIEHAFLNLGSDENTLILGNLSLKT
jgi:hypothetical protein